MRWYYTTASNGSGFIKAKNLLTAKITLKKQGINFLKIKRVTVFLLLFLFLKKIYFAHLNKQKLYLDFIFSLSILLKSGVSMLKAKDKTPS